MDELILFSCLLLFAGVAVLHVFQLHRLRQKPEPDDRTDLEIMVTKIKIVTSVLLSFLCFLFLLIKTLAYLESL